MSINITIFGNTLDGSVAHLFTISNKNGLCAKLTDFGAVLVSLIVPDKTGNLSDIVLGFDTLEKYFDNTCYFGSTIGRNSNRIKNAEFTLNNKTYYLNRNEKETICTVVIIVIIKDYGIIQLTKALLPFVLI